MGRAGRAHALRRPGAAVVEAEHAAEPEAADPADGGLPARLVVVARPIATISPEGNGTYNCAVEPANGEPTLGNPVRLI